MHSSRNDMETLIHYSECGYGKEKICRFCGSENYHNVDIFSANKADDDEDIDPEEDLLHQISTVYPIVLYENDPLPQHICTECIDTVGSLYRDIQQVLSHQKNLMNLIKVKQPDHEYFRIINSIEESIKSTKESIKTTYDVDINPNIANKFLTTTTETAVSTINNSQNFKATEIQKPVNESLVKNIQTKLELNGFTIKRIKVATAETNQNSSADDDVIVDENEKCSYCDESFSSQEELAQHQVKHLQLSTEKIFERRLLPKHLRRGRLITINDEKNIRCLNCWQIFRDNKAILQHWSGSECHFYCCICSKEFSQSPKLLREHMPEVHGISFRSATKQFMISRSRPSSNDLKDSSCSSETSWKMPPLLTTSSHQIMPIRKPSKKKRYYYKTAKSSTKHDDGTFSCNVCHKVFTNYRSSNSHMRVHYMSDMYSTTKKVDVYTTNDDGQQQILAPLPTPGSSTSSASFYTSPLTIKSVRPAYKIVTNNGPLRGIKTKIVQKRNDFLANNGSGNFGAHSIDGHPSAHTEGSRQYDWMQPASEGDPLNEDDTMVSNHSQRYSDDNDYTIKSPLGAVKTEPGDSTGGQWTCFICKEYFGSSRDYEMHAMFVHNIN